MGIDLPAFRFLLMCRERLGPFGQTLILGRQALLLHRQVDTAQRVLNAFDPQAQLDQFGRGYHEPLLKYLGGAPVHTLDSSDYEGAAVIHDLNTPLPDSLAESYDTVIDIGTLEHVFNIAEAFRSCARMVRSGGRFLSLNIANHHLGHGFWQFSPEAYYRTFSEQNGYVPELAYLHYQNQFHELRDPETAGRRLPLTTPGYTYITFAARRVDARAIMPDGWPIQADYKAAWIRHAAREAAPAEAERMLRDAIDNAPRNPLYKVELGQLLQKTQANSDEIDELSAEAYRLAPDNPEVIAHLARRLLTTNAPDQALAVLEEAGALPQWPWHLHKLHGEALEAAGRPAAARDAYARAQETAPKTTGVADRIQALDKALAAAPDDTPASTPAGSDAPEAGDRAATSAPAQTAPDSADSEYIRLGRYEVRIADQRVPETTQTAVRTGRYEFKEREVARHVLDAGDRVIELGAGMGVVSMSIAGIVGPENVLSFEPNPDIIELARANYAHNDLHIRAVQRIARPRAVGEPGSTVPFFTFRAFEASSMQRRTRGQKQVDVPVSALEDEISAHGANALVMDIEGGEAEICEHADLTAVDKIVVELHPKILGESEVGELIDTLEAGGLYLQPSALMGDVVAFGRTRPQVSRSGRQLFAELTAAERALTDGDREGALAKLDQLSTDLAANPYFHSRRGLALVPSNRNAARKAYERAIDLGSGDHENFSSLASLLLQNGNLDGAAAMAEKALAHFEHSHTAKATLARVARARGNAARAKALFEDALQDLPNSERFQAVRKTIVRERDESLL